MTVYVYNMEAPFGRYVMCHMWADTRDELFTMVDRIGVKRKWFQRPADSGAEGMAARWEHFDIAKSKRALAVAAGAVETDKYGPLWHTSHLALRSDSIDERIRAVQMIHRIWILRERP